MRDKNVVLLNSGGLDSFLAGKWLETKGYSIHSLYIHHPLPTGYAPQPPSREAATQTAEKIDAVNHLVLTLDGQHLMGSQNKSAKPFGSCTLYLNLAAAYAYNIGARYVASGLMQKDKSHPVEKDYFQAMATLFKCNFFGKVGRAKAAGLVGSEFMAGEAPIQLLYPVFDVHNPMAFMQQLGLTRVDIAHTSSCEFDPPCGVCYKCHRRRAMGLL